MKWLSYIVLIIVLLLGAVFLTGYLLPARTTLTRSIDLKAKPEAVFAVLANVQQLATWSRNTEKVEMLPPTDGKETTRQTFKGGIKMIIITTESRPPNHLVRSLDDNNSSFVGSWTYNLTPNDGGTRVMLTEVATVQNPLLRVMTRLFGQTKYMDEHLEDLAKKLGETAKPS